jgi:hypothetical protein
MLTLTRRSTLLTGAAGAALAAGCTLAVALPAGADAHVSAAAPVARTAAATPSVKAPVKAPVASAPAAKVSAPSASAHPKPAVATPSTATHTTHTATAAPATHAARTVSTTAARPSGSDYAGLSAQQIAARLVPAGQLSSFEEIISHESGWDVHAVNASSGAYGLGQALPAGKMAAYGADWQDSAVTQIKWALSYMDSRYGSPNAAWAFWQAHNWY